MRRHCCPFFRVSICLFSAQWKDLSNKKLNVCCNSFFAITGCAVAETIYKISAVESSKSVKVRFEVSCSKLVVMQLLCAGEKILDQHVVKMLIMIMIVMIWRHRASDAAVRLIACLLATVIRNGVARILLQGTRTRGARVVIQKWKPSGVRSAKRIWLKFFVKLYGLL